MSPKKKLACLVAAFLVIAGLVCGKQIVGWNNSHSWQVLQSVQGNITIIEDSGVYNRFFGSVWDYPRVMDAYYSEHSHEGGSEDQSVKVTFNDSGTAQVSTFVRFKLPTDSAKRLKLHQEFNANPENVYDAVRSHLRNCINVSGPVMSASENQNSRKAEFNQIVEEQLVKGLFAMRRTEVELNDVSEVKVENGERVTKKARVQATEIIRDKDGKPIIIEQSPLAQYGIEIVQFSITDIRYDDQTLLQFKAKKEAYLNAERSKAQQQEEVQQRLMIVERGLRQVAEIAADENQKKERAEIQAQQAADVAMIAKTQAVTQAAQKTEVAEQARLEALKLRDIAKIKADTAELNKAATISQAEGQKKVLELGGGMSDHERVALEIQRDRDIGVSANLAKVVSPGMVVQGGGVGGSGDVNSSMLSIVLLKSMGILPDNKLKPVTSQQ